VGGGLCVLCVHVGACLFLIRSSSKHQAVQQSSGAAKQRAQRNTAANKLTVCGGSELKERENEGINLLDEVGWKGLESCSSIECICKQRFLEHKKPQTHLHSTLLLPLPQRWMNPL
jgi:hypothetical protein